MVAPRGEGVFESAVAAFLLLSLLRVLWPFPTAFELAAPGLVLTLLPWLPPADVLPAPLLLIVDDDDPS